MILSLYEFSVGGKRLSPDEPQQRISEQIRALAVIVRSERGDEAAQDTPTLVTEAQ